MRILILSINYWPEVTGIGAFTTYRAEYLAAAGHDVEVCTTFPYYPEWKVPAAYKGRLASTEERNGVRIFRGYAYIPNQVTALRRIIHEGSFVMSSFIRAGFRKRPDVLLVVSPPLGLALPAIILSRAWRIPYVFDVEDLQPDAAADLGMLPAWAVNFLYSVERTAYRNAALVTTLTSSMRRRILEKGVPEQKVHLVEPRMDESLCGLGSAEEIAFRRRYGLGDTFLVTYSGNMGVKQGLNVVLDAADLNRNDKSILFLLVGSGADCHRLQRRTVDLKLSNVRFLPLLNEEEFRGMVAASGICLVTQQKSVSEVAFPSKIITYLAAARPIIASVNPESEVALITRESGAGKVVAAEDAEGLLAAVRELRENNLEELGRNGFEYAKRRWAAGRVLGNLEKHLAGVTASAMNTLPQEGALP
ncbi:MAG TPA: glycosyltransferase family 4 protein [Terracidiphilus sp.]|nr:glycosyltransferase family 4 protein [Terracidiphilus sp.]